MVRISRRMQFAIGQRVDLRFVPSVVVKTRDITGFGFVQFLPPRGNAALLKFWDILDHLPTSVTLHGWAYRPTSLAWSEVFD